MWRLLFIDGKLLSFNASLNIQMLSFNYKITAKLLPDGEKSFLYKFSSCVLVIVSFAVCYESCRANSNVMEVKEKKSQVSSIVCSVTFDE